MPFCNAINPPSKTFVKPLCVVCEDDSCGQHFGQYSCKACAAFFRRAVASKMTFECRFDKRCDISPRVRNICRYCRYQKCLDMGMNQNAVQAFRDSYDKRFTRSPSASLSYNANGHADMRRLPQLFDGYVKFQHLRSTSFGMLAAESNSQSWDPGVIYRTLDLETLLKFIPQSTYSSAKKGCHMETSLAYDMIMEDHFAPFSSLTPDDRKKLFDQFSVFFCNAEKSYNTYKAFGHIENNDKVMLADGGYVKLDEVYKYYVDSIDINADPEHLARIFVKCFTYIAKVVVPAMVKVGVDDYSMSAIYGLALFQDYNPDISFEAREIAYEIKEDILRDLHVYYKNQGLNDVELTTKISKLMLLVPTMEHLGRLFRENFHLADLFCMLDVPRAYK
uniref:Uncharacterized protein n=1 Tax=Panagrolaimus sp. PS1159 TaxID=55785 RepID=A0AC35GVF1_9BILA